MRGLVIVLSILAGLSLFSLIAVSSANGKIDSGGSPKKIQFETFTSAVCENKNGMVHCRDEFFVNCDGKISQPSETAECNGFRIDNKVAGFAVFGTDWKDPRQ